jgi:hypothetical protein
VFGALFLTSAWALGTGAASVLLRLLILTNMISKGIWVYCFFFLDLLLEDLEPDFSLDLLFFFLSLPSFSFVSGWMAKDSNLLKSKVRNLWHAKS